MQNSNLRLVVIGFHWVPFWGFIQFRSISTWPWTRILFLNFFPGYSLPNIAPHYSQHPACTCLDLHSRHALHYPKWPFSPWIPNKCQDTPNRSRFHLEVLVQLLESLSASWWIQRQLSANIYKTKICWNKGGVPFFCQWSGLFFWFIVLAHHCQTTHCV